MLAIDREARTIEGLAVPFGVAATAPARMPRRYPQGSLTWAPTVSLLIEHDQSLRVGRAIMIDPREYGLWMIFLLRGGREGDHGLALATSTYTGLSIGVDSDQWHIAEDGVRECISARVIEVSLTRNPVFS